MSHGLRPPHPRGAPGTRLNLGCGTRPLEGFVNVDILPIEGVDVVADLKAPLPFSDGTIELVYASHILEHFPTDLVPTILRDWRRVLRCGGSVYIGVPDLEVIARCLLDYPGWFTPPHNPWHGAIYGGQKDDFDFHRTGFTLPWLSALLTAADFGSIERVDWFRGIGAPDLSRSEVPFGRNMSLNVRAVAGGSLLARQDLDRAAAERALDSVDRALQLALRASVTIRSRLMARRRARLESALRAE